MKLKEKRKTAFYNELEKGKKLLKSIPNSAFYHFENAHILGQTHLIRHTLSHYWLFIFGIKTKNNQEIFGQVMRILASILFTLFWVPKGNTGGSNISATKSLPIRDELKKYFSN